MNYEELRANLARHGQEGVLALWEQTDPSQRAALAEQISQLDLALIDRLYQRRNDQGDFRALASRAGSPPAFRLCESENQFTIADARQRGQALARARSACCWWREGRALAWGSSIPRGCSPSAR